VGPLEEQVKKRLKRRTAWHGRNIEEEARDILRTSLVRGSSRASSDAFSPYSGRSTVKTPDF
jgi:plasmid stability protein